MKNFHLNHYERAFGNWLIDNSLPYIAVDEQKRAAFGRSNIKSFDYLFGVGGLQIIAEVKGRKFKGASLAKLAGFECWVTTDDVDGLAAWQGVFGAGHFGAFVFAYEIANVDVDFCGRGVYEYDGRKYIFFAVRLDDYLKSMKVRSPKWKTVALSAEKFRQCATEVSELLA